MKKSEILVRASGMSSGEVKTIEGGFRLYCLAQYVYLISPKKVKGSFRMLNGWLKMRVLNSFNESAYSKGVKATISSYYKL